MAPQRPDGTYRGFLTDPDLLDLDTPADLPALPPLHEPDRCAHAATDDDEPLVPLVDRRIRTLATYWHTGWTQAQPATLVRRDVADRLQAAARSLPDDYGLAVLDAWRPLALQAELYTHALTHPTCFVSAPSTDPADPPPHLTGGSVDLTLTWRQHPLALGSDYDTADPTAWTNAYELHPGPVRDLRRLLYWTLHRSGFIVLDREWWHFEFGTPRWSAITGQPARYGPAAPTPSSTHA